MGAYMAHRPLLTAVDVALVTGAALRVTRFATTDVLGGWLVSDPLHQWAARNDPRPASPNGASSEAPHHHPFGYAAPPEAWRHRLVSALDCPYCVGTQAALAIAAVLALTAPAASGSPARPVRTALGRAARAACAALAASYVVGHVSHRLDSQDAQ
uniref:DUF1360 domain-containing protein n=1 Tax=Dulem virus 38 TaxID=3145756 RepID=A0AAU8B0C1_9CAUD